MRFFVRVLAVLGILALIGLVTGLAYTAGLNAAGVAVHPAVYGFGLGFFGFGLFQFFGFLLFLFVLFSLLRLAFGGRRGWAGRGGWGPYGRSRLRSGRLRLRLSGRDRWTGPDQRRSARGLDPRAPRGVASHGSRRRDHAQRQPAGRPGRQPAGLTSGSMRLPWRRPHRTMRFDEDHPRRR